MPRNFMPIALGVFALLVIVLNSAFIVRQDREAIVLRVGQFTRAINSPPANESGLYFKWPFIEEVTFYDRRNLGLELDGQQIVASDQELLVVDAVVRWRITDARLFYPGARTEQGGPLRQILARHDVEHRARDPASERVAAKCRAVLPG